jgi:hypothetical protein
MGDLGMLTYLSTLEGLATLGTLVALVIGAIKFLFWHFRGRHVVIVSCRHFRCMWEWSETRSIKVERCYALLYFQNRDFKPDMIREFTAELQVGQSHIEGLFHRVYDLTKNPGLNMEMAIRIPDGMQHEAGLVHEQLPIKIGGREDRLFLVTFNLGGTTHKVPLEDADCVIRVRMFDYALIMTRGLSEYVDEVLAKGGGML